MFLGLALQVCRGEGLQVGRQLDQQLCTKHWALLTAGLEVQHKDGTWLGSTAGAVTAEGGGARDLGYIWHVRVALDPRPGKHGQHVASTPPATAQEYHSHHKEDVFCAEPTDCFVKLSVSKLKESVPDPTN